MPVKEGHSGHGVTSSRLRASTQGQRNNATDTDAFEPPVATVIGAFTAPGFMAFLEQSYSMTFIQHLKIYDCPVSSSDSFMSETGTLCHGGSHNENMDVVLDAIKSSGIPSDKWTFIWIGQTKRLPLTSYENSADSSSEHVLHKENLDIDYTDLSKDPFFIAIDDLLKTPPTEGSSHCFVSFDIRVVCQGPEDTIPFISLNTECHEFKGRQYALSVPLHYFTYVAQSLLRNEPPSSLYDYTAFQTPGSGRLFLRGGGILRTKLPLQSDIPSSNFLITFH